MSNAHDESAMTLDPVKLDRLAEVAVRQGLNLQGGQNLIITAPLAALPLVRRIAVHAYKAGAGVVTPIFADDDLTLARYENARESSFDTAPAWLFDGMAAAFGANTARLAITGDNPMLLADQNPGHVSRVSRAQSNAYKPALAKIAGFDINWTIVSYPTTGWAQQVFPDRPADEAVSALADAIFKASRVEDTDPLALWERHNNQLKNRCNWLNRKEFQEIRFTGPGTDLRVGLAEDHLWQGGASEARNGIRCNPNIPTEEVFTTPHSRRVSGHVAATKPLAHQGTVIEDIRVTFHEGRVVDVNARTGADILRKLVDTDEGAGRLGEVALVPHSSPISQSGLLFYNTLFDENAASHIAFGQCYAKCFRGSPSKQEVAEKGGNESLIHVDWMIGSGMVDVDGYHADGSTTPIMRQGEWAFT